MAKFIIIRGSQSSGKTTTAGLVYQRLLGLCDIKHKFNDAVAECDCLGYPQNMATIDFTALLTYKGKTIGIISDGDVASEVRDKIKIFIKINVDIIICCARSRNKSGSTYRMIIDEFDGKNSIELEAWATYEDDEKFKFSSKKEIVTKVVAKAVQLLE